MPARQVTGYSIGWDIDDSKGAVSITLEDGEVVKLNANSAEVLAALAAILNESSVTYNDEQRQLYTASVQVSKPPPART